jgi:hypothetical protein
VAVDKSKPAAAMVFKMFIGLPFLPGIGMLERLRASSNPVAEPG